VSSVSLNFSPDKDMAYLTLPAHPGKGTPGCVAKSVRLSSVIKDYQGPDANLDFDANGVLIRIEFFIE